MHLIDLPHIKELLKEETDIELDRVESRQCFLTYAPMDIPADKIGITQANRYYIDIDEVITALATRVFGCPVTPMFDQNKNWTHIMINE